MPHASRPRRRVSKVCNMSKVAQMHKLEAASLSVRVHVHARAPCVDTYLERFIVKEMIDR